MNLIIGIIFIAMSIVFTIVLIISFYPGKPSHDYNSSSKFGKSLKKTSSIGDFFSGGGSDGGGGGCDSSGCDGG